MDLIAGGNRLYLFDYGFCSPIEPIGLTVRTKNELLTHNRIAAGTHLEVPWRDHHYLYVPTTLIIL